MFSRALYKQSWKANWVQWLSVVLVSCFVLTIIMVMSGGDKMGSLTASFTESFAKGQLESNFENTSINYYNLSHDSLETFDKEFLNQYVIEVKNNPYQQPTEANIATSYMHAVNKYQQEVISKITAIDDAYVEGSIYYDELLASAMFVLNPNGVMNEMYEQYEKDSTPPDYDVMTLILSINQEDMMKIWSTGDSPSDLYDVTSKLERKLYRVNRTRNASSIFMAGNMASAVAKEKILETLKKIRITEEIYDSFGFDYQGLKNIANAAILTFEARFDYEVSKLNINDFQSIEDYYKKVNEIRIELQSSITATLMTKLPSKLANSLTDMQNQDMYGMTVGNMYFQIVGLLISIVYIIMVGVNLISGQVDSGSMAYILSTGTKRNTVTITQMLFFVSSTLFLFITTSIVSFICYKIAPPTLSDITLGKVLLFNLGSFLVTMALGGIIYLASCIFNRSKRAMALGGGFAILTLVFTILGMFASDSTPSIMRMEALNVFNKVSLVTLFDIASIINETIDYIWKFGILASLAIICFIVGIIVFKKKDLPL